MAPDEVTEASEQTPTRTDVEPETFRDIGETIASLEEGNVVELTADLLGKYLTGTVTSTSSLETYVGGELHKATVESDDYDINLSVTYRGSDENDGQGEISSMRLSIRDGDIDDISQFTGCGRPTGITVTGNNPKHTVHGTFTVGLEVDLYGDTIGKEQGFEALREAIASHEDIDVDFDASPDWWINIDEIVTHEEDN